LAVE
jgi:hypothetical protein